MYISTPNQGTMWAAGLWKGPWGPLGRTSWLPSTQNHSEYLATHQFPVCKRGRVVTQAELQGLRTGEGVAGPVAVGEGCRESSE